MAGARLQLGLADITGPMGAEAFLRDCLSGQTPCVLAPNARVGTALAQVPEIADVERALAAHPADVTLMGPDGFRTAVRAEAAAAHLQQGKNLYLRGLERSLPALSDIVAPLAAELGFLREQISIDAFAGSAISTRHYDHEFNFQLLLAGEKQWALAPNTSIVNPLHANHLVRDRQGQKKPETFREETHLQAPIPDALAPTMRFTATVGSVVFIPRGWWHEVEGSGQCWAINIVLTGATYAEALAQALVSRLHQRPEFRAYTMQPRPLDLRAAQAALAEISFTEMQAVVRGDRYQWVGERSDEPLSKLEYLFTWADARNLTGKSADELNALLARLLADGAIVRR